MTIKQTRGEHALSGFGNTEIVSRGLRDKRIEALVAKCLPPCLVRGFGIRLGRSCNAPMFRDRRVQRDGWRTHAACQQHN